MTTEIDTQDGYSQAWSMSSTDGLQNLLTGMGTTSTKRGNNEFVLSGINDQHSLDAIYRDTWLGQQIVDIPASDATREGRIFNCKDAEEIAKEAERVNDLGAVQEAFSWSRLYGGAVILMLTNQNLEEPLNLDKVKKGDLNKLIVFERYELSTPVINMTNPLADDYLLPSYYTINQGSQRIHWSHFVRFEGKILPRRIRFAQGGWGDSVIRKLAEDLADMIASKNGVAELIQEANVDVIERNGLSSELAGESEKDIMNRYMIFRQMKSLFKISLLDGENETYSRHPASFAGLSDVLNELRVWISGAADIPVTRLFGESAKGLNATGEGDQDNYYDSVKSLQNGQLREAFKVLDEVMVRSAIGNYPEDYEYQWNPLVQQSGSEKANEDFINAQTDRIYLDDAIVTHQQVAMRLQQENRYAITDEDVEALKDFEDEDDNEGFLNGFNIPEDDARTSDPEQPGNPKAAREEEDKPEA